LTRDDRWADDSHVTISVLGPFLVEGDASSLEPRDRVVLEVLSLRPGEVVSSERLADAVWSDVPPPTWHKVVQGSVVRLRKVLGAEAIETAPAGYRLTIPSEQVDMHRFERMARRGMELLALGEYDRASYVTGEALTLWRGAALRELEDWDTGRIEAGRLDELRLDAEEVRVEAALRAGHHRQVLAEAQARAAEAPLRERRWALLALAQYQVGRQADALRTLRQARRTLVAQLGLEPGSELVALEQAILRQDPSLVVAAALPESSAVCPYLGLVPYDVADSEGFFGRDREVEACLDRLSTVGVLMVVGPSGSGKSSLVRAGVAAALLRNGRAVSVITPGARPVDALVGLPTMDPPPILVVDQCEEALTLCDDPAAQTAFFDALAAHAEHAPLVVALRADRLGELSGHPDFARLVEPGLHLLSAMSEADLRAAIDGPARQAGLLLEPGLVDLLLREVLGEPGALPLLSHALHETWERREGRTLTVEGYQATGGIRGAVAQSAEKVYGQVPAAQQPLLRDLLLRLVSPTPEGEPVRSRVPRRTVATDAERERLVELLVEARLVTSDDDTVELAHESLARAWPRLRTWLDDDVDGQRIRRHLALAADAWDGMGRPDSELYRGIRLGHALDWQRTASPVLTPAERAFLDTSAERERLEAASTEQRLREQTRHNRRLRALLVGVGVLLAMAVVAGLIAVRQAHRADRTAVAADARRVGAQALVVDDIDHSLLLAAEGVRLDDSIDTRNNLLAALSRAPELIASTPSDGPPFLSVEVSPDGRFVAVGKTDSDLSVYDTSTRELVGSYDEMPVMWFEFRPDGRQLAVNGMPDTRSGSGQVPSPPVRLVDTATWEEEPVQLGGIPIDTIGFEQARYSADGRFLTVAFEAHTDAADTSVLVWDLEAPQQPVLRLDQAGHCAVLSPDGSRLYVGDADPPRLTTYEVATGRRLRSSNVPGCAWLDISPDGSLLAAKDGRNIVIVDADTLELRRRLEGHTDDVLVIRFSPSGALLASGSTDRTAIVWDVATGERRELLRGNSAWVWGTAFSPDENTLYTTAGRTLLTWDLAGDRRFIARHPFAEPARPAEGTMASPTGDAVAYLGADELQFVDLRTGRAGPYIDTGHGHWGWFAWRPDGSQFATTGDDGFVRLWDWRTGRLITERHVAPMHISALDYTGDGRRLVIAERTGTTYAIDAETLEPDGTPVELGHNVVKVYASPDSRTAVVLTDDRFSLVDVDNGRVIHEGEADGPVVGAFSPDGRTFALGTTSGEVRLLDVERGQWRGPPEEGHNATLHLLSYAPDGTTFATGADDQAVVLWDATTGSPLYRVLPGRSDGSMVPWFLDDESRVLITSSLEGAVYTFELDSEHWIDVACTIAGRNLTEKEWSDAFGDRPYRETCSPSRET
jgi:WD40 repeat protein/DNA-binding SARP family transcriptional activator